MIYQYLTSTGKVKGFCMECMWCFLISYVSSVDDGDDRGQFLGLSQDKLKKLDDCNDKLFLDMAICRSNHIDIAETAKVSCNFSLKKFYIINK